MPTTIDRYRTGEAKPRFAQRPAPRRPQWLRAAVLVIAAAVVGLALGGAFDLLSPTPAAPVIDGTTVVDTIPPLPN